MLRRLRLILLVADPGLQRTLLAGRATLSVGLTMAAVFPLTRATGNPPGTMMLAASIAMIGSFAVSGPDRRAQGRAGAIGWAAVMAAVTLGAALSPYPIPSYAAFVAIMAVGAWAGRFGTRGFALASLAVMAYFFALFTGAVVADVPWLILVASTGLGVALVTRLVILPDPPSARLGHLLVALRAKSETLIDHASRAGDARRTGDLARRLRRDAAEIDGVVLQLHDILRDAPGTIADARRFRRHLAAVVTLAHLLVLREQRGQDAADPALAPPRVDPMERLRVRLSALEAVAAGRDDQEVFRGMTPFDESPGPDLADWDPARDGEVGAPAGEPMRAGSGEGGAGGTVAEGPKGWLTGSRRTALQVTIAGAASIAIGYQLSPERWYWAAISAYFVFVNTSSRGATLRKALERMIGTAAGVAGGMLVGYLLAGHHRLELIAILPLLFIGYWMLSVSYAVMIGMITILIALIYDLMGMLTTDVLLLRLEETVIGAGVGTIVAYFVLPTRTRGEVDRAFGVYLAAMDELLLAMEAGAEGGAGTEARILDAVHDLDRAVGALRAAVRPVIAAVPGRRSRALKQEMILALTARYWIHRLAGSMLFHSATVGPEELRRQTRLVRERIARLVAGADGEDAPPIDRYSAESSPLQRVDAILAELGRARRAAQG